MRTRFKLLGRMTLAAAFLAVLPMVAAPAHAADDNDQGQQRKTRQVQAASRPVYDKLQEAQDAMDKNDTPGALKIMQDLEAKGSKLSSYERVLVYQLEGFIYANEEKYPQALSYFQKMLGEKDIPPQLHDQILYTMGQLYLATEQYQKSVDTLKEWFKTAENPAPVAYMTLANAYVLLDDYKSARQPAEEGLKKGKENFARMTEAKKKDPEAPDPQPVQESWYTLTLAIANENKDYKRARELLGEMLERFPKRDYWLYLSGVSSQLNKEWDQLDAMEAAYRQDLLIRSSEYENLAQLYMYHNIPIKGAWVMEKAMKAGKVDDTAKNWELLANAYYNAQEMEKSISPLTKAAQLSDDGKLYVRLGQSYMDLAQWDDAAKAFQAGIKKGGLDNPGEASLFLGMSYYNGEKFADARTAFRDARDHKETKKSATQWLSYLAAEEKRHDLN